MGHDGTCCEVTIDKSQFGHTFIMCKKLQKKIVIGLEMQQLHHHSIDGLYLKRHLIISLWTVNRVFDKFIIILRRIR